MAKVALITAPGGYGGSDAMRDSAELIAALQEMAAEGKWVCAICAAPEGNAAVSEPLAAEKVAVLMPEGCEERETVQIMDLLMRSGLTCTSFATGGNEWVHTMKRATGYTGYGAKLTSAQFVADQVAVWDANVVASQDPCAPHPFAFKFMEAMGIDSQPIKDRLLYDKAGGR